MIRSAARPVESQMKWTSEAIQRHALVGASLPRDRSSKKVIRGREEAGTSEEDTRRTLCPWAGHGDAPAGTKAQQKRSRVNLWARKIPGCSGGRRHKTAPSAGPCNCCGEGPSCKEEGGARWAFSKSACCFCARQRAPTPPIIVSSCVSPGEAARSSETHSAPSAAL